MARASKWKFSRGMVDVPVHVENYNGVLVATVGKPGKYIDVEIERDEIKSLMGLAEPCGWHDMLVPEAEAKDALGVSRDGSELYCNWEECDGEPCTDPVKHLMGTCGKKCYACDDHCSRIGGHDGNHEHYNFYLKEWVEF